MDFAGPLIPSIFHRFVCYCCAVDAGSSYGRTYPAHHMTAAVATASLDAFTAEVASLMPAMWAGLAWLLKRAGKNQ